MFYKIQFSIGLNQILKGETLGIIRDLRDTLTTPYPCKFPYSRVTLV